MSQSDFVVEFSDTIGYLEAMASRYADEVPYAMSRALNRTAWKARKYLQEQLPSEFVVRNQWTSRGMQVEQASKRKLLAVVGSVRDYMEVQTTGGDRPHAGETMGVPIIGGARKTKRSIIGLRNQPAALLKRYGYEPPTPGKGYARPGKNKRYFMAPIKGGPQVALYKRLRKRTWQHGKRTPLQIMYAFKSVAKIDKRWRHDEFVTGIIRQFWGINAAAALRLIEKNAVKFETFEGRYGKFGALKRAKVRVSHT